MSVELGRRLLASELVTRENVRDALLLSELRGISLPRALIERGIVTEAELDDEIARLAGPGLRYVQGSVELVAKLPRSMSRRLCALPTRTDPLTGVVDVAAADPFDPHVETEMAFHLNAPVRVLRASIAAVEEAIRRIDFAAVDAPAEAKPRPRRLTPALPYGAPGSIPPPAPSTPIPLVVKRAAPPTLDDEDTYVDDLSSNESDPLGRTAGWGTVLPDRHDLPNGLEDVEESASLGRTAAWGAPAHAAADLHEDVDTDESPSLGRTAAWGAPARAPAPVHDEAELDESPSLGRTAAWGAPARAPAPMRDEAELDESPSLGRTAAWGTAVPNREATAAPVRRLNRTLGFEEEPQRVSFPSAPPPGHESVPPPLGFAPPEVSAWKGLTNPSPPRDVAASSGFAAPTESSSVNVHEAPTWRAIDEDTDIETTFVSAHASPPEASSRSASTVETISLNSIPEAVTPVPPPAAEPTFNENDFDDVPQRATLVEFPPPTSMVDVKATISALASVTNRDAIVDLAFRCMSLFAHRVALFTAKRDAFHGWMCNEAFGSPEALRKVVIPNDQPSIMATAMATSIYLGPIPKTRAHEALLAVMGTSSRDVAVATVRVGGKVAAMLVADELRDTLSGTRRMDELARAMGDALTRLVKARG
ncbi:MAG: hypothetical protein IPM54_26870 [Polyangiaceae bacterium]|nr:hypothetical protein [Polyangiaceae bacterium]